MRYICACRRIVDYIYRIAHIVNFHKIAKCEPNRPDIFDVHYIAHFVCADRANTFLAILWLPANVIWQHHLFAVNNYFDSWVKLEGFNVVFLEAHLCGIWWRRKFRYDYERKKCCCTHSNRGYQQLLLAHLLLWLFHLYFALWQVVIDSLS